MTNGADQPSGRERLQRVQEELIRRGVQDVSMEYIRRFYGVPAKRGAQVEYLASDGELMVCTIVGSDGAYLRVRIGNNKRMTRMHPTWALKYLPDGPEFDRSTPAREG